MTEKKFPIIGIIQDSRSYLELAAEVLEGVATTREATDMITARALIHSIANGQLEVLMLAFDENLTDGEYEGVEGSELYKIFCESGLAETIYAVSISSDPKLPIKRIGSSVFNLRDEVNARLNLDN